MIFQANGMWKQAEVVIHISDKADFRSKLVRRNKENYYIVIKGKIHQEDTTIVNLYEPNISISSFHKTNTAGHKETVSSRYKNSGWLQHSTLINR
jgi:hypothetical protein